MKKSLNQKLISTTLLGGMLFSTNLSGIVFADEATTQPAIEETTNKDTETKPSDEEKPLPNGDEETKPGQEGNKEEQTKPGDKEDITGENGESKPEAQPSGEDETKQPNQDETNKNQPEEDKKEESDKKDDRKEDSKKEESNKKDDKKESNKVDKDKLNKMTIVVNEDSKIAHSLTCGHVDKDGFKNEKRMTYAEYQKEAKKHGWKLCEVFQTQIDHNDFNLKPQNTKQPVKTTETKLPNGTSSVTDNGGLTKNKTTITNEHIGSGDLLKTSESTSHTNIFVQFLNFLFGK